MGPKLSEAIRQIKACAATAAFMVMADKQLSLKILSELMELGVWVVIDKPLNAEAFSAKVEQAKTRANRLAEATPRQMEVGG